MTGGREHQGSSCRGVGVVRLEPFDPSSGSGRGLLAESSNAEDVRPKATSRGSEDREVSSSRFMAATMRPRQPRRGRRLRLNFTA